MQRMPRRVTQRKIQQKAMAIEAATALQGMHRFQSRSAAKVADKGK